MTPKRQTSGEAGPLHGATRQHMVASSACKPVLRRAGTGTGLAKQQGLELGWKRPQPAAQQSSLSLCTKGRHLPGRF